MEFLVIVLFVVAIVAVNFVISRAQRRKKQAGDSPAGEESLQSPAMKPQRAARTGKPAAKPAPGSPRTSAEAAREANARLDSAQHQQVYAAIAQGHPIKAVKLYAQFTGVGVRAAGAAIENLAMHPQPYQAPAQGPAAPAAPAAGAAGSAPASPATGDAAGSAGVAPDNAAPDKAVAPDNAAPDKAVAPDDAAPDKTVTPDKAAGDTAAGSDQPAAPDKPAAKNPADSIKHPGRNAAAKPPATPEEDEISQWVKNLRPEDF